MTPIQAKTLEILTEAATAGKRCPKNAELVEMVGLHGAATGPHILRKLEQLGHISVERFQCSRVVTIVKTGLSTAGNPNATPHWRDVDRGRANRTYMNARPTVRNTPAFDPSLYVYRDPCPRCAVRADIGCKHRAAIKEPAA